MMIKFFDWNLYFNLFILFIYGFIIGSFLNVMICRLPRGESIVLPPSHCPHCQHRLMGWDLVPLLSFLCLRGKCRYCGIKINWRYPLVEFLTGALTLVWWLNIGQNGISIQSIVFLILSYALLVIAMIDIDHHIIPDKITLPLIIAGLVYQIAIGNFIAGLLGLIMGGGLLLVVSLFYSRGMGLGDVKLLAMVGTFVGWQQVIGVLFLGSTIGVVVMIPVMVTQKMNRKTPFAFGPFLVLATLIVIYRWNFLLSCLPF